MQSDPFSPNGLSGGPWERLLSGIRPAFSSSPWGSIFALGERMGIFFSHTSVAQNKAGVPRMKSGH